MRIIFLCTLAAWSLAGCSFLPSLPSLRHKPSSAELPVPAHAVVGVTDEQLDPAYWIEKGHRAEALRLTPSAITVQNEKLLRTDTSVRDVEQLPGSLSATEVRGWINTLSSPPTAPLYDEQGQPIRAATLKAWVAGLNLDAVPASQTTRYGIVVQRADLRTFPTRLRVFSSKDDVDIDRFQETALFPGTPVAIVHQSRDGKWLFVVSEAYAAWIEKVAVAEGPAEAVFRYGRKSPYLVVTGATAKTVFAPQLPAVSELQLDMGVRVPVLADWPANRPVNGQHPYTSHVIELPIRGGDGSLRFVPALLPKTADVSDDYLALNRANVLRQGFKFLGERYGWGHSYNARDCSGFVSEVYRSFNVRMPRNARDQGVSPAFNRMEFTSADSNERRLEVLSTLQAGDLVYIPRHVMMVIGHDNGVPYVIHDTTGISYREAQTVVRVPLNGVAVTPLTPLLLDEGKPMVDSIYSIVQIRR